MIGQIHLRYVFSSQLQSVERTSLGHTVLERQERTASTWALIFWALLLEYVTKVELCSVPKYQNGFHSAFQI